MDLQQIFTQISNQMQNSFVKAKQALPHPGLKGDANEEIVRKFFREYLPRTLDISTGMLVDSHGNTSKQLDILVSDAAKTPIFFQSAETRVVPVECAYAVIEVKAFLSKAELEKAYHNMKSAKSLKKEAFFDERGPIQYSNALYGKEWGYWPLHNFVFAYDSDSLDSVKRNLDQLQNSDPVHQRIDLICVLEKGVILNRGENGMFLSLPEPGSETFAVITQQALLLFYSLASLVLNQVKMRDFNIHAYIKGMKF